MTDMQIGPLAAGESDAYLELMSAVWGDGVMTDAERHWWYLLDPCGRGSVSVART